MGFIGDIFGGGSAPAPTPPPSPEEIAKDRLEEEQSEALGRDRQIRASLNRRGSRSLMVATGLGVPGVTTNRST